MLSPFSVGQAGVHDLQKGGMNEILEYTNTGQKRGGGQGKMGEVFAPYPSELGRSQGMIFVSGVPNESSARGYISVNSRSAACRCLCLGFICVAQTRRASDSHLSAHSHQRRQSTLQLYGPQSEKSEPVLDRR